ncbi:MAG: FGGY family carbohydrate kinase, partial [Acidimicrobiales bacterium]
MTAEIHHQPITVGIDIGTTSVKAVAVSEDGEVLARARVPHRIIHTSAHNMEHDALAAWRRGPLKAYSAVSDMVVGPDSEPAVPTNSPYIAGICVAGMVPSLTAVDRRGMPRTPGLLYGDIRGETPGGPSSEDGRHGPMPDAEGFLLWTSRQMPGALGYWPAQAVATHALTGHAAIDTAVTSTLGGLYRSGRWNEEMLTGFGVVPGQLPEVVGTGSPAATLRSRRGRRGRAAALGAENAAGHPETVVAGGTI